jgi:hypothetical protein
MYCSCLHGREPLKQQMMLLGMLLLLLLHQV